MLGEYRYESLADPVNSIRLVSIEPGWPSDPICINLLNISHGNSAPPYQALSYVWGSTLNPVSIQCNGANLTVTQNLGAALRALRQLPANGDPAEHGIEVLEPPHVLHANGGAWKGIARNRNQAEVLETRRATPDEEMYIWIDALCINQADLHERGEQVKGMRRIYSLAKNVRIWLGTELVDVNGSTLELPAIKTPWVDRAFARTRLGELGHMPVVLSFIVQALRNRESYGDIESSSLLIGFPPQKCAEYTILEAFFDQPWFRRVWIIQEVVVAREATITLGDWEMDWEPFMRAVTVLNASYMSNSFSLALRITGLWAKEVAVMPNFAPTRYLGEIREVPGRVKYLLPLLVDSRDRKATNQADHVFALLGMTKEMSGADSADSAEMKLLEVNYTKPVAEVFTDATKFIILHHQTLAPLMFAEWTDGRSILDCPSWVPIWSEPSRNIRIKHDLFNAGNGVQASLQFRPANVLRVFGYILEPVERSTDELENVTESNDLRCEWHYPPRQPERDFATSAWSLVSDRSSENHAGFNPSPLYRSKEEILGAFAYTLSGNRDEASPNGRADGSDEVTESARAWLQQNVDYFSESSSFAQKSWLWIKEEMYPGQGITFQACLLRGCWGRKFFITRSGFMGIGPCSLQPGDLVVVILGLTVPLIVRKAQTAVEATYTLVGTCYVHGIMDGELVKARQEASQTAEMFDIV
jgi:hypothetical protein